MAYAFACSHGGTKSARRLFPAPTGVGSGRWTPVSILQVTIRGARCSTNTRTAAPGNYQPEVAFLISDILSDNNARTAAFGANSALKLPDRPAAAKTGTTNDYRDAWTMGFTPQYTVGVWVGNTDSQQMKKDPGSRAAAPIWNAIMQTLHEGLPVENFSRPENIVTAVVDSTSGKLPTDYSPQRIQEVIHQRHRPTEYDDVPRPSKSAAPRASWPQPYCPVEEIEEQVFSIYPAEASDWVREQGIPQPPTEYCDVHGPNLANTEVAIVTPRNLASVSGVLSITGNTRPDGLERFWLEYGEGATPENWVRIGGDRGDRVENGELAQWDTKALADGLYTLRLSVVARGNTQQVSIQVLVDNTAPEMALVAPFEGQKFIMRDEWITIQANAEDNIVMDRVEFFLVRSDSATAESAEAPLPEGGNPDESLGYTTIAPYTARFMLNDAARPPIVSMPSPTMQPATRHVARSCRCR